MDAFQFGTLATPDDAYRYAKGEAIRHPAGFDMQLDRPLDFYAVTDHGIFLGVARAGADTSTEISAHPSMAPIHNLNAAENLTLDSIASRDFRAWIRGFSSAMFNSEPLQAEVGRIMRTTWQEEIRAADQHDQDDETRHEFKPPCNGERACTGFRVWCGIVPEGGGCCHGCQVNVPQLAAMQARSVQRQMRFTQNQTPCTMR